MKSNQCEKQHRSMTNGGRCSLNKSWKLLHFCHANDENFTILSLCMWGLVSQRKDFVVKIVLWRLSRPIRPPWARGPSRQEVRMRSSLYACALPLKAGLLEDSLKAIPRWQTSLDGRNSFCVLCEVWFLNIGALGVQLSSSFKADKDYLFETACFWSAHYDLRDQSYKR